MARQMPRQRQKRQETMEDTMARVQGQKAYFNAHPEKSPAERDELESKVGNHPPRIKVKKNGT